MLDWYFIYSTIPKMLQALLVTLKIAGIGIFFALLLGFICSMCVFYRIKGLHIIANGYVTFFRNTPFLLQLFFMYYGFPRMFGLTLDFSTISILGLTLLGGSYMYGAFQSGISLISKNQIDSAKAIGLNNKQIATNIILPQSISYSIANLAANCIFLFKETSVFTCIAGTDVTTTAINLISSDYKTNEALFLLIVSYLIVLVPFILCLTKLEKKIRYAEFGY